MSPEILNIRGRDNGAGSLPDLRAQVWDGLSKPIGERWLPTMLLYDERGLRLYDDLTTNACEYYLFGAEEGILKKSADDIITLIHQDNALATTDEVVLELGAG